MSFATGQDVMRIVESIISDLVVSLDPSYRTVVKVGRFLSCASKGLGGYAGFFLTRVQF